MARVESVSVQRPECFAFALLRAPKPCALLPYSAQGCQESCREKQHESRFAGWQVSNVEGRATPKPEYRARSRTDGSRRVGSRLLAGCRFAGCRL